MDATIVETGFHDQVDDAKILRDPKGRNWMARAVYHAVIKYMNEFDGLPLDFLPEPPLNVRAIAVADGIKISWAGPGTQAGSDSAAGYVVYTSTDGYGFGNPVGVSGGGVHTLTLTNLLTDVDYYFRVAATNAGGESFPSETVGCRRASTPGAPKALFVNGFDRFERKLDLRQTPSAQNYKPPGNTGTMVRVIPRTINSFDYVVTYGEALGAYGMAFDSCQNQAITNDVVALTDYPIVIWACGNESNADETFDSADRSKVTAFLAGGGHLFVSGSEIAWDLDKPSGPSAAERDFLHTQLHAAYASDDSTSYTVSSQDGSIFDGRNNLTFDDGSKGIYWVQTPDVIVPNGPGARVAMNYSGGTVGASAIQYDGSAGGGKVVYFAFPFDTVINVTRRKNYLADILDFFTATAPPPSIAAVGLSAPGQLQLTLTSQPGSTLAIWRSEDLLAWEWCTNLPNPTGNVQFTDPMPPGQARRFYRAELLP